MCCILDEMRACYQMGNRQVTTVTYRGHGNETIQQHQIEKVSDLGQEIVQSHRQTLDHFVKALEEIEGEMEEILRRPMALSKRNWPGAWQTAKSNATVLELRIEADRNGQLG